MRAGTSPHRSGFSQEKGMVVVINCGEETVAWLRSDATGEMKRLGTVPLAASVHPGLATSSFALDPSSDLLFVAHRPAQLVCVYAVSPESGDLASMTQIGVPVPSRMEFMDISASARVGAAGKATSVG